MKHRLAFLAATTAALAAPAAAQAATLADFTGKPCYGGKDEVGLVGTGYPPGGPVAFSRGGRVLGDAIARADGTVLAEARVPLITSKLLTTTYTATARSNPAITASTTVRFSRLNVRITPKGGNPRRKRRIRARGFTAGGKSLYVHIVRGKRKRNVRVGRLKGACKTLSRRLRLFGRRARFGGYRVQFDAFKRYKRSRRQKNVFKVRIIRVPKPSAASSSSSTAGPGRSLIWTRAR